MRIPPTKVSLRRVAPPLLGLLAAGLWLAGPLGCGQGEPQVVTMATTTSTANSGLLDDLLDHYRQETGVRVDYVAVGTGKALKHGENGDVDLVLVHAPAAEEAFVAQGFGVARVPVMWNDFVVLGPPSDPAELRGAATVEEAFQKIAEHGASFVSRGDDSGTHKKERTIWQRAQLDPSGEWYVEAGQGMGACLTMADDKLAYVLTDRGTYLAMAAQLELEVCYEGGELLRNPYALIAINAERYPDLNHDGARRLIEWMTSAHGQELIGAFQVEGEQLFHPVREETD